MTTTTSAATTNVATVSDIYAAFGSGDMPTFMGFLAEDVSWEADWEDNYAQHDDGPAHFKPYRGKAALSAFFDVMSLYTFHDLRVLDVVAGGSKVVAQVALDYTMPGGGRYRDEQMHLWTFGPDGTVVALRHFMDTAKILAATRGDDTTRR